MAYGPRVVLQESCAGAVERVRRALAEQDFRVLSVIELSEAVETELGLAMPTQFVLGVCRATVAEAALRVEPSLGLLLPMPVVVRAEAPDVTVVEAANPMILVAITGNPALEPLVADSKARLAAAFRSLQA